MTEAADDTRAGTRETGNIIVEIIRSLTPFAAGLLVLWFFWSRIDSGLAFDLRNMASVPKPAFKLTTLVYALFLSSMTVVFVGTCLYILEFNKFMDGTAFRGRRLLVVAQGLCILAVIIMLVTILVWIGIRQPDAAEACDASDLIKSFFFHDIFVILVFLLFVVIDTLTIMGLRGAIQAHLPKSARREQLCDYLEWAKAQLFLIDLPVLLGSGALWAFVHFVETGALLMTFDEAVVKSAVAGGRGAGPGLTNLTCNDQPLDILRMVGNVFTVGAGMGSLAAQIFVSQIVFVTLGFFFRYRRNEGRFDNSSNPQAPTA
jgi:hypothetical protein